MRQQLGYQLTLAQREATESQNFHDERESELITLQDSLNGMKFHAKGRLLIPSSLVAAESTLVLMAAEPMPTRYPASELTCVYEYTV